MRERSVWNVDRPETRELAAQMRKLVGELGYARHVAGQRDDPGSMLTLHRRLLRLRRLARPGSAPDAQVVVSTASDRDGERVARVLDLRGDEGVVLSLAGHPDAVQAPDRDLR